MRDINNISLSELIPSNLMTNEDITNLTKILDKQLHKISNDISKVYIINNIDNLDSEVLGLLAIQFDVDFYNLLGTTLEKKKELIKNSIVWHRHKGTKSVLEDMLKKIYTEKFEILEWFEYSGRPYYFKILLWDVNLKEKDFKNMMLAINELKNARSKLEVIEKNTNILNGLYTSNLLKIIKETKISKKGLITGVGGRFYTVSVISVVKNIKIEMESGVYGEL